MRGTLRTNEAIHSSVSNGTLVFELKCQPSKADVTIVGNNYSLVPLEGANGPDVFTYTVTQMVWDASLGAMKMVDGTTEETNLVTLTILPVNQPPVPTVDTQLGVIVSSTLDGNKLEPAAGVDADGHKVTYTLLTAPQLGTFRFIAGDNTTATGDSSFVYTSGSAAGTETLVYQVDDCTENADLRSLAAQVSGTAWNRLNCMKGLFTGQIQISVALTDALQDVDAGTLTLFEDQAVHQQSALTRKPSADSSSDAFLRFVMRSPPSLGAVDFLCAWEVVSTSTVGQENWTQMGLGQYCENVGGSNGTQSQVYRFRPTLNVNGADVFDFGLRGVGSMASKTPPADKSINVTILPTNDAPVIPDNLTVVSGSYVHRDGEKAWADPLVENATAALTFTALTFSVTSIDGERTMSANVTNPALGKLYTSLTSDGTDVDVNSEYVAGALLNMTLDDATATNATTSFNLALYYVAPAGFRGSPVTDVYWYAWDGTMTRSIQGQVRIQVLCPLGFYKQVANTTSNSTYGECAQCAAGSFSPVDDASRCTPTDAGYFTEPGAGRQVPCPIGTYSSAAGSASCARCPANLGGDVGETSTTDGTASTAVSACVCKAADTTSAFPYGYYGAPGEPCYYCEDDASWTCTENNLTLPMPKYGYWIDVCQPYPASSRQCFPSHACGAIVAANVSAMFQTSENVPAAVACAKSPVPDVVDGTCDEGYEEEGCSACIRPGFYRLEGNCRTCPETDGAVTVALISVGVIVAAPVLFKVSEMMAAFPSINIGISFAQYLGLFALQLEYPQFLRRLLSGFSFFNLNLELIHPECSIESWDFSKKWQVMALMPVFVFVLLAVACACASLLFAYHHYVGARILAKYPEFLVLGKGQRAGLFYKMKRMMILGMPWKAFVSFVHSAARALLTFLKVAYVFLASSAFELFDCSENVSDGLFYLDAEPSVRCGWPYAPNDTATRAWLDIYQYAIASIVLYPVGIFLLFATLMYMIRYSLDSDGARAVLGFFYHRYEKQWYWYELVLLVKKVILVAILFLMPDDDTSLQSRKTCCSIALVTLVTLMHFYAAPYESSNLDNMMSMSLGAEFLILFSGLIFLTDKLSETFRAALTILNVVVIIAAVCFLSIFVFLDIMPGHIAKLKAFLEERKNSKERKEKKKKMEEEKKARKSRGEKEEEDKPLSIYAQFKVLTFIKRALVSAQAARFFSPRATDAAAAIRTAWGQKRVRELGARGEMEQPNVTKEELKALFNKLQERTKKRETFSILDRPDPIFSDFLKDGTKSDCLEGLALEDITENHLTDHFFEKLMCDQLPVQQKTAEKTHWFTRFVNSSLQGRSTWKRRRHALEKLQALEARGLLTLTQEKVNGKRVNAATTAAAVAKEDDPSFSRLGATDNVDEISSEDNTDNDSAAARREEQGSTLKENPAAEEVNVPPGLNPK